MLHKQSPCPTRRRFTFVAALLLAALFVPAAPAAAVAPTPYYRITVIDADTSRGIPLVRLRTTNSMEYWTDSAGVVAYLDPGMMGKNVFFEIASYGYSYPKDAWFQIQGILLTPMAGDSVVLKMHRDLAAQRLYRITGADIYRDSVLLGDSVPRTQDDSHELIIGQDSVHTTVYRNKLFWLWGDTGVSGRFIGNFKTTCANSELPERGGMDPERGVYLTYYRNDGSVKGMVNIKHGGPIWLGDLRVVLDETGKDRMVASYVKVKGELGNAGNGLVVFNDETQQFDELCSFPLRYAGPFPRGNGIRYKDNGTDYFYYCGPFPNVRSRTDYESLPDLSNYEAMTCFKEGSGASHDEDQLDRDANGNLIWGWKKNATPANKGLRRRNRQAAPDPRLQWYKVTDIETGAEIWPHGASVYYNAYRKRWVSIVLQNFGKTWLGETWYLEGDTPLGPWVYATKVVTHHLEGYPYTFYNPFIHPEFDKEGGRKMFFEATYTAGGLSAAPYPTPRYNYNQMMYMLDLNDPRVMLPVPLYHVAGSKPAYGTKNNIPEENRDRDIVAFVCDRPASGTIGIYDIDGRMSAKAQDSAPLFYALSAEATGLSTQTLSITAPLNEFTNKKGAYMYSTSDTPPQSGYVKSAASVCRVWKNPLQFNPYKVKARAGAR